MRFTGQCQCGLVKVEIAAQQLPALYACHCLNCQRWSGSSFALHMLCAASAVGVAGETATYVREHQGHTSRQHACGVCHTRLFNETTAAPGMRVVRAGMLEGSEHFEPVAHIWTRRKQPWLVLPPATAQWEESPTPEAFAAALGSQPRHTHAS
ncbi:aldehyde-activating protein [Pseudomonas sp. LB-090624]|uniref:GFA family protein n=1 Tax=Pseudomonas TaxID=286 RepID=UPI000D92148F|nr:MULTISPECIES: GFA family protein [unclassified Pseudomonas]MCX2889093.1 GFA family protein [Pseudomonas sp. DCB_BI]MDH4548614.1 GFA family protein [Pseudomonas sp. BN607]PYB70305.1 aldehyde-activating protein [Pseudomonas sp. LB-090624]